MTNRLSLTKTFRFEASHVLPKHPGKCSRLHGHSWVLDVTIDGPVNPETGFVIDYYEVSKVVNEFIIGKVDHQHLGPYNLVTGVTTEDGNYSAALGVGFYPSSENLIRAFVRLLRGPIQSLATGIDLLRLTLHETCTCECTWDRTSEDQDG